MKDERWGKSDINGTTEKQIHFVFDPLFPHLKKTQVIHNYNL